MNNDYLWDKSGRDEDGVAELEASLSTFRMRRTAAPPLPLPAAPPSMRPAVEAAGGTIGWRRWFWIPALAGAAILVGLGLFAALVGRPGPDNVVVADPSPIRPATPGTDASRQPEDRTIAPRVKTETPSPLAAGPAMKRGVDFEVRPVVARHRTTVTPTGIRRRETRPAAVHGPQEALTSEERDAYEKLVLALSITGSKLRIVREKIRAFDTDGAAAAK